ncbi:MAG TPA: hypothetical protein VFM57_04540 [Thermoleophilaceae bacterium]|nr:hypothetical protein [Thermoleophilaceae bacterium]
MKSLLRRRPSPAMVIALIALFVSLSGVSYGVATGFIDSREIKNNEVRSLDIRNNQVRTRDLRNNEVRGIDIRNSTVQGRDVALNTLTGDDIREDSLGKVPSAGIADSASTAGSADSADSVGGLTLHKIAYAADTSSPSFTEILNAGGLRLEADCDSGGTPFLIVRATPAVPNSELRAEFPGSGFGPTDVGDFDTPTFILDATTDSFARIEYTGSDGRIVSVTGTTRMETNGVRGTTDDCGFFGVASAG